MTSEEVLDKAFEEGLEVRCAMMDEEAESFRVIAKGKGGIYIVQQGYGITIANAKQEGWFFPEKVTTMPKAFKPKEGQDFWRISTEHRIGIRHETYDPDYLYHVYLVDSGLAFRSAKDAVNALRFMKQNIEVGDGKEQE